MPAAALPPGFRFNKVVAIIAFDRFEYFRQVIDALRQAWGAHEYVVTIWIDGPPQNASSFDQEGWQSIVTYSHQLAWLARNASLGFRDVVVNAAEANLGLKRNIRRAVAGAMELSDFAVILEDDIVVERDALRWFEWHVTSGLIFDRPDIALATCWSTSFPFHHGAVEAHDLLMVQQLGLLDKYWVDRWFQPWGWALWRRTWDALGAEWKPRDKRPWDVRLGQVMQANSWFETMPLVARCNYIGSVGSHKMGITKRHVHRPSRGTQRALQVVCGSGGKGSGPGLTADQQRRAVGILSAARNLDFRRLGNQLGGTLVVDDASHKQDVQQAIKEGNLSFGFSAGGCLFPYYIGSAGALIDAGILTERVKIGGASAGSLLAACIKSGMPLDNIVEQNLRLLADLRQGGTRGRLGAVLHSFLREHLPEDAHLKCKDKAYVAVTKVTPIARPLLVSDFSSRADLIQALMTSCHIPFWLDGNAFTEFRGERHCDGGLTNFIPLPPGTVGVRICCFPSRQLSPVYRIGISPDSFEPWEYSLRQ
ncbi:hypothetical protein CHLNCDRAFT_56906 [Chlorella variabilis]|uniref:Patatin n=1 Tax=Chlorella variabilis TaxID=554065 RepID=E1Z5T3_CHLVA|nr:hypothetical protein CHLNCDRAFT_56906 [Chlorella variabilis]EFN58812.1 hypothetical protein CHLNCDRAFT_56906 [Chlorella variabilis]|eukprot:XP_005850914.1 hypothetical protein CHLNCDRAFT_56906 [Chlorella variabilis]